LAIAIARSQTELLRHVDCLVDHLESTKGAVPMTIRTYAHRLTRFAAAAGLAGLVAIAVPAMASASQSGAVDSFSIAVPVAAAAADNGPVIVPRICCFRWFCWLC